jgi:hypothetical protein
MCGSAIVPDLEGFCRMRMPVLSRRLGPDNLQYWIGRAAVLSPGAHAD